MKQQEAIAADQDLEQLTNLFRLLADKTRLSILILLSKGERNVTSLCEELSMAQPTVSHHLGLLRTNNIIGNRRDGKQVFYELNGRLDDTLNGLLQVNVEKYRIQVVPREI
jgi:ArsR family transcriptional regulator, zinc-responsive transcriptional repressor